MTSSRANQGPEAVEPPVASAPGPLPGPVACIGAFASLVVLLQSHRLQPNPAVPMLLVASLLSLLRGRAARAALCGPLVVAAFVAVPAPGLGGLLLRLLAGLAVAVGLVPVALASLRAGSARRGSAEDASQRRSPWVVAAGSSALVGELARQTYTGMELIPDARAFHSPWEGAVAPLYAVAAAVALILSWPDARALWQARSAAGPRDTASLVFSLALDAAAVATACACFGYRARA